MTYRVDDNELLNAQTGRVLDYVDIEASLVYDDVYNCKLSFFETRTAMEGGFTAVEVVYVTIISTSESEAITSLLALDSHPVRGGRSITLLEAVEL